tara:strand:+ start:2698 stop:3018 length:321 start_codon:yes stop_codon:yes gene_type:complete
MILYTSSKGQWVGTQRDAQRYFPRDWKQVDVPVSKVYLIEFLNENKVGATQTEQQQPVVVAPDPEQIDPEAYGWVSWAYETLKRGDKHEAIKMLERGLEKQKELIK